VLGPLLAVTVSTASAQTADPVLGTWEMNVAKSTWTPGPAPKSETRTYTAVPNGYKFSSKSVGGDGKPSTVTFTAMFDGKYHPLTGSTLADSIMVKRVDANTTESTQKKGDKVVSHGMRVVAKDGKTMTNSSTGTDAAGKPTKSMSAFDKK